MPGYAINRNDWRDFNQNMDGIYAQQRQSRMDKWAREKEAGEIESRRRLAEIAAGSRRDVAETRAGASTYGADARKDVGMAAVDAKNRDTDRKATADEGRLNINQQKLDQNAALQAQKAGQWEQNFKRLDASGQAKELQAFVAGVQKSVDSAAKYGVDDTTAQSIADGMAQWTPEQEMSVKRGAPATFAKLKGAQRIVDGGRNPFPLPIPGHPSEPTAVAYKKNYDKATQDGDTEGAKYYQALMQHVSGADKQDNSVSVETTDGKGGKTVQKMSPAQKQLQDTVAGLTAKLQTLPAGSPEALAAQKALGIARQGLNQIQSRTQAGFAAPAPSSPTAPTPPAAVPPATTATPTTGAAGNPNPMADALSGKDAPATEMTDDDAAGFPAPTASPVQSAPPAAAPPAPAPAPPAPAAGRIKVRHKVTGQVGTVPESQLQDAIAKGFEPFTPPPAQ